MPPLAAGAGAAATAAAAWGAWGPARTAWGARTAWAWAAPAGPAPRTAAANGQSAIADRIRDSQDSVNQLVASACTELDATRSIRDRGDDLGIHRRQRIALNSLRNFGIHDTFHFVQDARLFGLVGDVTRELFRG